METYLMSCTRWRAVSAVSVSATKNVDPLNDSGGVDAFSVLNRAVSFAVSFSRHSIDLRVRCYDTDAQDLA